MYRIHRSSTAPVTERPTSKNLWHLLSTFLEEKLRTFLNGGLWLARLDQFLESTEAQLPSANRVLLVKAGTEMLPWIEKQYKREVKAAYASCWHMSDDDPTAYVWEQFGLNGQGLAIKTTPELMTAALRKYIFHDGLTYFSAVQYVDHETGTIQAENVIAAALVVSCRFEEEQEARVLIHPEGNHIGYLASQNGPYGPLIIRNPASGQANEPPVIGGACRSNGTAIVLPINPEMFIQEIVLGPKMEDHTRGLLMHLIQEHGLSHKLRS